MGKRARVGAKRLSVLLLTAALLLGAYPVAAAGTRLTVTGAEALPPVGESFTVTLSIQGSPGLCIAQGKLLYTESVVRCDGVSLGGLLDGMLSAVNPRTERDGVGAVFACASVTPTEGDGALVTIQFTVLASGDPGFALTDLLLTDGTGAAVTPTVTGVPVQSAPAEPAAVPDDTETEPVTAVTEHRFTDTAGHWGESWINRAAELGLFLGNGDGSFSPDAPVTRGAFAAVLWRMAGCPAAAGEAPFTDLGGQSREFRTAIAWAYEAGIVSGVTATAYAPNAPVKRQEAMKMLFLYAGGSTGGELMYYGLYDGGFTDSGQIAAWAKPAMYWAYYRQIITGTTASTLSPTAGATRAELAKILVNYLDTAES